MSDPYRLPRAVLPRRYDLTLEPDLRAATFDGAEDITVEIAEATDEVVLNAVELEIDEAWVVLDGGRRLEATVELDEKAERAHLRFAEQLPVGPATVGCRFRGVLNDKLVGFYRSTFVDDDGETQFLATTQMEATHARQAFPCWDEPEHKAVFAVTLVVDRTLTALSNTSVVEEAPASGDRVAIRFADTMPMSTYLVAFVVGPLEVTEAVDVGGVPLRVACVRGKGHLTPFALEIGAFCLERLAGYYDIPYPGDKLDLVAIPDFAFGAMENLGCVTFRETLLLADPARTSRTELERIVDVIAHEIAHMWFGDLVTMRWWNGIWLNEAFATFMEMKTTDAYKPDWDRWATFGVSRSAAFDTDALGTTRPVEYEVVSPAEAEGMFDVLTYEKGAAVVRMLEQYLGEQTFRDGIAHYLRTHAYGNTETTDLWDALEETSDEPVRRIMDSWIFQGGFPEVEVDAADGRLVLRQRRFRYDGADDPTRWAVPVVVTVESGGAATVEKHLLDGDELAVDVPGPIDLVKANTGASGFYRVRYAGELLHQVAEQAQSRLTQVERFSLVDDTWAMVLAGSVDAVAFLELAERFTGETDLAVWRRLTACLATLERLLDGAARDAFVSRACGLVRPVADRLGTDPRDGESENDRELRAVLLAFRGITLGEPSAIETARGLTDAAFDGAPVEPSLAAAALRVSAAVADEVLFDRLVDRFRAAATPQEQQRTLYALAGAQDAVVFERLLDFVIDSGEVRTQNMPFVLQLTIANAHHGRKAWVRVGERWDHLLERLPASTVPRMIEGIRHVHDAALARDVEAFLAAHPIEQGRRSIEQHIERMQVSVALAERETERLVAALR